VGRSIPAPHAARFFASLLDTIVLTLLGFLVGFLAALLANGFGQDEKARDGLAYLFALLAGLIYHATMNSSPKMATLGKQWMGLKVVTQEGGRLSWMRAATKITLQGLLPYLVFLLFAGLSIPSLMSGVKDGVGVFLGIGFIAGFLAPYFFIFGNEHRRSLYDFICGTKVIKA
jgi:uncharacterized RDD family membrane protein YckC